ncbi:1-acylglycerol-3-phosphate O-acyltransferase PNPLA3 isoform X1 [Peromyscus californicus insignis]|uniref:1-acylglycerol-3-phosphate O-acyltransferase PNPLA3 isoform X1 n=1 Tax=Peromyscus californicus insignis TaxID=564181 RepID=UPI0022A76C8C|nr:1-acylglycerol-3-phosphate O-acyltransferase PNPLA3 isoform X1 [Peromyscus californicus insignis]
MYDPERCSSLSFAGCGFLGFYHIGATLCLSERAPHLLGEARTFFGCSAGALHAVAFVCRLPLDQIMEILMDLVRKARRRNIGSLHPFFNINKCVRDGLQETLPDNVHQIISGKVYISLTRVSDGENVLVSDFHSKDEVVDALVCSCFIPFFSGLIPPSFRGERYVDGGVSDNVPLLDAKTTITVSPFYGEHDICPKVKSTNFFQVNVTNLSLRLCTRNLHLLSRALFPPDVKVMGELCFQGYLDAFRFLAENGICNGPQPGLSLSSEETESEATPLCPENSSLVGDKLPASLYLTAVPWDESIQETLSPQLSTALSEAIKDRDGYLSKACNLLPIRILSYIMLPCTLPVELAIATVHRLVMWLPDLPDDIQWLQWATSQVCARVTMCLLPSTRSQASKSDHGIPKHGHHSSLHKPQCSSAGL